MASISTDKNGLRRIQFVGVDGKKRSLRLGRTPLREMRRINLRVEMILSSQSLGHPIDDETERWLAGLNSKLLRKLARVGLIPEREECTLAAFVDRYIARRTDIKAATADNYRQVRNDLVNHFGADMPIRTITPGDADEWRVILVGKGLAENTVRRRSGLAKQFFEAAHRKKLIASNPFADLKCTVQPNPARQYFVTREKVEQVIDACPNAEWRLIFALSRYGGLRCPSEHCLLRWSDFNWARGRMLVRSPKTEHYPGRESRVVPIFPELLPYLREAHELAVEGDDRVIVRNGRGEVRKQMATIVRKAGVKPWPRISHNMRSSRQTELQEEFPSHVVCAWLGNSQSVAVKHYLQVTDEHFDRASTAISAVAENPAQYAHEHGIPRSQPPMLAN